MRSYKIYGISAGSVLFILALGILIYFVSENITYLLGYAFVILILMVVAAMLLPRIYRDLSNATEKKDTALYARKREILQAICDSWNDARNIIRRAGENIDVRGAIDDLERVKAELVALRCLTPELRIVEANLDKVDLTFLAAKGGETKDRLTSIKKAVKGRYEAETAKQYLKKYAAASSLLSAGFDIGGQVRELKGAMDSPAKDLDEAVGQKIRFDSKIGEVMGRCADELSRMGEAVKAKGKPAQVDAAAAKAKGSRDIEGAAKDLVDARNAVSKLLEPDFAKLKRSVAGSLNMVAPLLGGHFPAEQRNRILSMAIDVKQMDDAGMLEKLNETERQYRGELSSLVNKSYEVALSLKQQIDSQDVPDTVWRDRDIQKPRLADGDLEQVSRSAKEYITGISPILERGVFVAKLLKSYGKVGALIDFKLKDEGTVVERDLNVKYASEFMKIYKKRNPKVRLIESPIMTLVARGAQEGAGRGRNGGKGR